MDARLHGALITALGVVAAATLPAAVDAWGGGSAGGSWSGGTSTPTPSPTPSPTSAPTATQGLTAAQCVGCHGKAGGCTCQTASCTDPARDVCGAIADRHHALLQQPALNLACMTCHVVTTTAAGATQVQVNLDCPSCHGGDPHAAAHATRFFPGWSGLPGVDPAAAAPWTDPPSYTPVASATAQWQVCYACHSSNGFGGTGVVGPSGLQLTDVAKEYNPANLVVTGSGGIGGGSTDSGWGSYGGTSSGTSGSTQAGGAHPVVTSVANDLGHTSNILSPYSPTSTMLCTDCHDAKATGPGTVSFSLKGPNVRWDASLTLGNRSGAFCFNCHSSSFQNTKSRVHVEKSDKHGRLQCFACHAAIPHGGPRPGMIVASAGASAAVGGVIPGWDQSAPYYQGTGTRFYVKSYPAVGTAWDRSNCGCNGTQHD